MSRAYGGYTTERDLTAVKKRMAKSKPHTAVAIMDQNDRLISLIWDNTDKRNGRKNLLNTVRMITMYASGTSFKTACELTGLKWRSCEPWKPMPWFLECVKIAKERLDQELDSKFTNIVQRGADRLVDQMENGEVVLGKGGEEIRKPVNAKDTAIITSIIFDKRNLLRGKPTNIAENKSTSERLDDLKDRFKQFANAKDIDGEAEIIEENADE